MKKIIITAAIAIGYVSTNIAGEWHKDFKMAMERAKKENKMVLLNFSGSDWCGPCIRSKKDVFDKELFMSYADSNLILVNADFPRLSKHALSKEQEKKNNELAEQFDKEGIFPRTLLLTPQGNILKDWAGYNGITPRQFIEEIKRATE